jgi:hypothetical protein
MVPLPFPDLVIPEPAPTHREAAEQFAAANPALMAWWNEHAHRYLATGRRIGMKALVEAARWEHDKVRTDTSWSINNSWTAHLARILIEQSPDLADVFSLREIRHG